MKKTGVLIGVLLFVFKAQAGELFEVTKSIQSTYEKVKDLKARFVQKVTYKTIGRIQKDEGVVKFKKPDKMKWEYLSGQQVISDGKRIWFYMPDEKRVITADLKTAFSTETPSNFLSGMGKLTEEFNVSIKSSSKEIICLNLDPKTPIENLKELVICVDKKDFLVRSSTVVDNLGNETEIEFKEIQVNRGIEDREFEFKIPQDVEVIESPKR
jgi:outer membrane lipoprotein carrier protein